MNEIKLTPIDQIEDIADGVPVLAIEGVVKYAKEITRSKPDAQHPWTKQFFVLGNDTASIACSMWDAEGSEVNKGETLRIENTQNKKGQWNGMTKSSYTKNNEEGKPERKHTLEIRANQVKITTGNKPQNNATMRDISTLEAEEQLNRRLPDPDWPEVEQRDKPHPDYRPVTERKNPTMLDERQRAIIRQHSQSMALEVLKLKVELKELTVEDLTPSKLKTLADFFDNDVIGAAQ